MCINKIEYCVSIKMTLYFSDAKGQIFQFSSPSLDSLVIVRECLKGISLQQIGKENSQQ